MGAKVGQRVDFFFARQEEEGLLSLLLAHAVGFGGIASLGGVEESVRQGENG